jgi:hypothetical protein
MSIFEFVYGFISILTSLALTHLLGGFVAIIRNAGRVRFSLTHALWAFSAFGTTIGNWASSWSERELHTWPTWMLLVTVATSVGQYVFCAFVTPDVPGEGSIDLVQFHERKRADYLWAYFALGVLAITYNVLFGLQNQYPDWWRDTLLTLPTMALILVGIFARERWVQIGAASIAAAIETYFMLAACNLAAS